MIFLLPCTSEPGKFKATRTASLLQVFLVRAAFLTLALKLPVSNVFTDLTAISETPKTVMAWGVVSGDAGTAAIVQGEVMKPVFC
jgi:hypothetical protein